MTNVLMVNPSVNMRLTAVEMKMYGVHVQFAYSSDVITNSAKRVFYFLPNVNLCFTTEMQGEMEREDKIYLFKQNIFSRLKMIGFKKNMEAIYKELSAGTFTDLLLFKRSTLKNDDIHEHDDGLKYTSFNDMLADNKDSIIITNKVMGQGGETVCRWNTDFDLVSTFSKDYFVFFARNLRIEVFVSENNLITIGKGCGEKHMEVLLDIIPAASKFFFQTIDEKPILRNFNPWLSSVPGMPGFLMNDYSFGNLSISMPSAWYDNFANFIHIHSMGKRKK